MIDLDDPPNWILDILICPKCKVGLSFNKIYQTFICQKCKSKYEYKNSVIKFVKDENYTQTFGTQWNKFRKTQIDLFSKSNESKLRFFSETGFDIKELSKGITLDAGCGAGRFMDIALKHGAKVIGIDFSSSVYAAYKNLKALKHNKKNYILIQASIYNIPIKKKVIERVYSIGVLQHMPMQKEAVRSLSEVLKFNGKLSMWVYEKSFRSFMGYKYLLRPLVKSLPFKYKFYLSKMLVVFFLPIGILFDLTPIFRKYLLRILPFAFRKPRKNSTLREIFERSLLDTVDNITPEYDNPISEHDLVSWFKASNITNINRLNTMSLALTGKKKKI